LCVGCQLLQQRLAGNATVGSFLAKSGVEKTEVMISGLWEKSVAEVLASEECGVPGGAIEVRAKKGHAEKPPKHKGGVVRQ
jgi:hypothetical protein